MHTGEKKHLSFGSFLMIFISILVIAGFAFVFPKLTGGNSILNRTATLDVGNLMLKYNGGGHKKVGTCQFSDENMEAELPKMLAELTAMANA